MLEASGSDGPLGGESSVPGVDEVERKISRRAGNVKAERDRAQRARVNEPVVGGQHHCPRDLQ
jgi:hypothetical protein